MRLASYIPLLVAPQTRSSNVVCSIHTICRRSTTTLEKRGSLHIYHFFSRHKHARRMWIALYTPFFVAPQTRWWNVVRFIRATFRRATNTLVECSSPHTHHFSSRNKYGHGKGLYISIRVRQMLMINVLRLKQSQPNEYAPNKAVLSNN
jgi:hypothetical protein